MTSDNHQIVRCQCSAKLRVPAAAVGRKVACPKCGFKILVGAPSGGSTPSAPKVQAASRPAAPPPASDEDSLLDDLLSSEASSQTAQGPDLAAHQKTCPKCKSQMTKDARVCLTCGHDPSIIGSAPAGKQPKAGKVGQLAVGTGRFGIGCALSAGGALLAAGLWYVVAIKTGFEIGYIAWGVGVLAGLGMKFGYGQENMRGAMAAMVMAAFGIFAAKGMIYKNLTSFVTNIVESVNTEGGEVADRIEMRCDHAHDLDGDAPWADSREHCSDEASPFYDMDEGELANVRGEIDQWYEVERWNDPEYVKTRLTYLYAQDMPGYGDDVEEDDDEWEWDDAEANRDWKRRHAAAVKKVEETPEGDRVATAKRIEQKQREEFEEGVAKLKDMFGVGSQTFFKAMFGPIDLIFILLALGSAIKLGGGQED